MKALSLWQPHASLVAHRLKGVETRGWATSYRGPVLIHAAQRWTREQEATYAALCGQFPADFRRFEDDMRRAGHWSDGAPPLGALVAVARVVDVREMTPEWIEAQAPLERAVGDWQPGRYGWVLEDVVRLDPPITLRGRQGLFEVKLGRDLRVADAERIVRLVEQAA